MTIPKAEVRFRVDTMYDPPLTVQARLQGYGLKNHKALQRRHDMLLRDPRSAAEKQEEYRVLLADIINNLVTDKE